MFRDRTHAAFMLVKKLKQLKIADGVVLAIPRGGVPIGSIIAKEFHFPLDLLMSKKIGHPRNEELAIGSVTLNDLVLDDIAATLPKAYVDTEVKRLRESLSKRYSHFTKGRRPYGLKGKNVIIVDDGLATGNTMLASIEGVRLQNPKSIIVAVPVSSLSAAEKLNGVVDQFVCLDIPLDFRAVGEFYIDFSEVPDQMVIDLLANTNGAVADHKYAL